jgi:hypothetical protein
MHPEKSYRHLFTIGMLQTHTNIYDHPHILQPVYMTAAKISAK